MVEVGRKFKAGEDKTHKTGSTPWCSDTMITISNNRDWILKELIET